MSPRELLIGSFSAAVAAVRAEAVLPPHLPAPPRGKTRVVGAGKAAADMAACVERHWPEAAPIEGLVITRHGHALPTRHIEVLTAGHPLPDAEGAAAAIRLRDEVRSAGPEDLVLALISGGGTSLLTLPAAGLTLADCVAASAALLRSGAPIGEINIVRKHLTQTLGGRLALCSRAPVQVLSLSDVVGDEPASIASGPFAADPSSYADAIAVLQRWSVTVPRSVLDHLNRGHRGMLEETPKPGDACFARVANRVVANGRRALEAAARYFRGHGVPAVILGDSVTGEARDVAQVFAALAREVRQHDSPWAPPIALLSGGETTVTVSGTGLGGRNTEFLLSLAIHLDGLPGVHALAADTDGIDGIATNAGALIAPDTLARATARGIDARRCLAGNNAHGFFAPLDDLLLTGPTRTNVNDYRVLLAT